MRDQQPPCRLADPAQRVHKNAEPGKPHLRWVARDWGRPDTRRPLFLIATKARMRNEGTSRKLHTGGGRPFPCPTRVEPFPFAVALAGRPPWPAQPSCQARSTLLPGPLNPSLCKCIRPECGTGQTSLDVAGDWGRPSPFVMKSERMRNRANLAGGGPTWGRPFQL